MKLDDILQIFVVKEKRFFPLFIQSGENILKASELLLQQVRTADRDDRRMLAHRIKDCENKGDYITGQILSELLDAYVTPFDREDIHLLAESMDTVLDSIRDASKKIAIYQPKDTNRKLIEIAEYIQKAVDLILVACQTFDDFRKQIKQIDEICDRVKDIEHSVDDIYESFMSNIFETETDAIELVKNKNIVQALEDTTDAAKATSGVIRSILVKMS